MGVSKEKKDIVEKEFLSYPDIAADTIGALLYCGKATINAGKLWPGPTETIYQGKESFRSQFEDVCKYEMGEGQQVRLMYLIANQTRTDGKMLFRKAGYTGGVYREQYEGRMKNTFPVIEIVLYWGKSRWMSSRNLRRIFRKRGLTDEEWNYIDELKLHVFEMRYLPEETRALFRSDMRIVVDFLAEGENYRSTQKITHKAALIKMLKVFSGDGDTENVAGWLEEQGIKEEDEITMCELFDQYERKGRSEGRAEGRSEGRAEGRSEGRAEGKKEGLMEGMDKQLVTDIDNVMKFFKVTLEKACEGLGTTVSKYEEARKLV